MSTRQKDSTLFTIILHHCLGVYSQGPSQLLSSPLWHLIEIIHYLPYEWRKLLLNACRVQAPIDTNKYLSSGLSNILQTESVVLIPAPALSRFSPWKLAPHQGGYASVNVNEVAQLFNNIYDQPMECSVLSFWCRAEIPSRYSEFLAVNREGILKEIKAS